MDDETVLAYAPIMLADSQNNSLWSKENILLIPVLATSLAIVYDVGFFSGLDLDLYTLFSLSEHILFAMEALPLALLVSAGMVQLIILVNVAAARTRLGGRSRRFILIALRSIGIIVAIFASIAMNISTNFVLKILLIIPAVIVLAVSLSPQQYLSLRWLLLPSIAWTYIAVYALGLQLSLTSVATVEYAHLIHSTKDTMSGAIIRSGERAYFSSKGNQENWCLSDGTR